MRFRKKGDGGGFKFKRMLSVEWNSIVSVQSSGDIADGTEQRAYIFGQPQHSLIVNGLEFINYKFSNDLKLTTSNGRRSPIVCGSLFNSPDFTTEDLNLRTISSTGAWAASRRISTIVNRCSFRRQHIRNQAGFCWKRKTKNV